MYGTISADADEIINDPDLIRKGKRLENFIELLFASIPGIEITAKAVKNNKGSQEIDLSLWNDKHPQGLYFFEYIILIECKNWKGKAGASDIAWFDRKIKDACKSVGIFISAHGVTGSSRTNTAAYDVILNSYKDGRSIIVITLHEIKSLTCSDDLIRLVKKKLCELALGRIEIKVMN